MTRWECEFVRREGATHATATALADEVEIWLVKRGIVDANAKGRDPVSREATYETKQDNQSYPE